MNRYLVKLVRDDIRTVMPNCEGGSVEFWQVGRTTHISLLKKKLAEEVAEYLVDGGVEELIDIQEVVEALARVAEGVGPKQLREKKIAKLYKRGGFMSGTAMYTTDADRSDQLGSAVPGDAPRENLPRSEAPAPNSKPTPNESKSRSSDQGAEG